jgi:predicted transcriptional regulator
MSLECNKVISTQAQYRVKEMRNMEELIGFVASDHKASKILAVLDSKGEMDSRTIAKTVRIVGVEKTLEELVGRELIANNDGKFALTELGKQVSHRLRGV